MPVASETNTATPPLTLKVRDQSRQRLYTVRVDPKIPVGQVVRDVVQKMQVEWGDGFQPRVERLGMLLTGEEISGEILQDEDLLTLMPNITAGRGRA